MAETPAALKKKSGAGAPEIGVVARAERSRIQGSTNRDLRITAVTRNHFKRALKGKLPRVLR
jgi:hypothetical protein